MFGIQNFEAFLAASIMLNLIPGPDTFYILGRSLSQGRMTGIASALGVSGGAVCHTLAAAIGLSALINASPTAFWVVKLLGAAYLLYLGVQMIKHSKVAFHSVATGPNRQFFSVFKQGVLTNALNPKVALFFLAFLPQFIDANTGSPFFSFIILGMTFVVTSTVWGFCLAFLSSTISQKLRENPRYLEYLNKMTGTLLIGLGIRLALDKS